MKTATLKIISATSVCYIRYKNVSKLLAANRRCAFKYAERDRKLTQCHDAHRQYKLDVRGEYFLVEVIQKPV